MTPPLKPRFVATVLSQRCEPPLPPREAAAFLRQLASRLKTPHISVAALFTDDPSMRDMNRRFRGQNRPTDVLSFPSGEMDHLGDIAISTPTLRRQARQAGRNAASEARRLMLHGFLHLLGYDHEADDGEMVLLERTLRREMAEGSK